MKELVMHEAFRFYEWVEKRKGYSERKRILQVLGLDNVWHDVPIVHGDGKPKIQYGIGHPLNSKEHT